MWRYRIAGRFRVHTQRCGRTSATSASHSVALGLIFILLFLPALCVPCL